MNSAATLDVRTVDRLLKALLVLNRSVDYVLETQAVATAVDMRLSASKVQVLRLLGQRGPQTSTQVARFLSVSRPAVTQIVDALVRAKLVARRATKHDRREVRLELIKAGQQCIGAIRRRQQHILRTAFCELGGRERDVERWILMLSDFNNALARADKTFGDFCLQCGAYEDGTCVLVGGEAECLYQSHADKTNGRRKRRPSQH